MFLFFNFNKANKYFFMYRFNVSFLYKEYKRELSTIIYRNFSNSLITISDVIDFVHSTIGEKQSFVIDGQFAFINFTDEYPLKKRDEIIQLFFNKLKELNIYVVEEEDDECIFDL